MWKEKAVARKSRKRREKKREREKRKRETPEATADMELAYPSHKSPTQGGVCAAWAHGPVGPS
jgi:hypothetical protein